MQSGTAGQTADLGIIVSRDCGTVNNEVGELTLPVLKCTQSQGQALELGLAQSHQAPRRDWELQSVAKSVSALQRSWVGGS